MESRWSRTELLLGKEALARLKASRVAVFGLGGVGGYVAEALARTGVGALDLIDPDRVCPSNLNRQILATEATLGMPKAEAAYLRVRSINPDCEVRPMPVFFLPETAGQFDFTRYDFVVDAIDTVTGKILLVLSAQAAGVPIISCMGTGNKLDPTRLEVADLYETSVCPLARIMRKELRRRGVERLKVVYSREEPTYADDGPDAGAAPADGAEEAAAAEAEQAEGTVVRPKRKTPGTAIFVPAAAGLIIASEVVKDLCGLSDR